MAKLRQSKVLHLKVNLGSFAAFVATICSWAKTAAASGRASRGRYVCIAPVALCLESFWYEEFRRVCTDADLVTPDGMPIVWALRRLGHAKQARISGPDLMLATCRVAARDAIPIGLYGGTEAILESLQQNLWRQFPQLKIVYAYAPPLRISGAAAPPQELQALRDSGASLLFVGLGCPKQELWMARYKAELPLVMLGVGAAFLFHSGAVRRAPRWMQVSGLEWLFRLLQEPKRLLKRYLKTNLAFLWHSRLLSARQLRKYL